MITKELVDRINFLSRKQRSVGLTTEEKAEQQQVRQQYLKGIREQLKNTLNSIVFVDPEETDGEHKYQCPCCNDKDHTH
ncbi:MAG: DUF896 domain-containing protein [Clostridia bacterium]|nr:DUF896 domain-containing protein [Clostridia bacterium]